MGDCGLGQEEDIHNKVQLPSSEKHCDFVVKQNRDKRAKNLQIL